MTDSSLRFPATLPQARSDIRVSLAPSIIENTITGQRKIYRRAGTDLIQRSYGMSYSFSYEQLATFIDFFENTLLFGTKYFTLDIVGEELEVKILNGYRASPENPQAEYWRVSFDLIASDGSVPEEELPFLDEGFTAFCPEIVAFETCANTINDLDFINPV